MSLPIPPEFAKKRITRLKCMNCRYEFNLIYSKLGLITAVKAGNFLISTCPNCKRKKQDLYVIDHEYDPMIPTYVEPSFKNYFVEVGIAPIIGYLSIFSIFKIFYPALVNIILINILPFSALIAMVFLSRHFRKKSGIRMWKSIGSLDLNTDI